MTRPPPLAAFQSRDFRLYALVRLTSTVGLQMQSVAVGWQVYDLTKRPLDLGLVGLVQFAPMLLLSLVTGHTADRFDRWRILVVYNIALVACALALLGLAHADTLETTGLWPLYTVLIALGTARAFAGPAAQAYLPSLVPAETFGSAVAWNSSFWQVATVLGPALGGVVYGMEHGPTLVYASFGLLVLVSLIALLCMKTRTGRLEQRGASLERLLAGVAYVRKNQILLGAISLDLFAVLLGGAVALLPAFARDILHTGPLGLGMLRSAPALGAASMAVFLAFRPLTRHAGKMMLSCVAAFGVATCVFGLSSNFQLSLAALVVIGAVDLVSVFVRGTVVQLRTPPEMRGRVSAVNQVFIGASNELGEFESGLTAEWFGVVPATVIGGLGTLVVVALWWWRFPALRDADRLTPEASLDSVPKPA